jgi:serine/threonine protein kinase
VRILNCVLNTGGLRRVAKLRPWSLKAVLMQKYDYPQNQAEKLRDFVLPMLSLDPNDRPSAGELAKHPWLDDSDAAPPYAADRVSAADDFYHVDDARLTEVLRALHAVTIQPEDPLGSVAVVS